MRIIILPYYYSNNKRVASATAAFGALKNIFNSKYLSEELN